MDDAVERVARAREDKHCAFCGKHGREVNWLVAGPAVCICDGCVADIAGRAAIRAPSTGGEG